MRKNLKFSILLIFLIFISFLSLLTLSCSAKIEELKGNLSFYVLSTGNANFSFIEKDGHAVVIDSGIGGTKKTSETMLLNQIGSRSSYWSESDYSNADSVVYFMKQKANVKVIDAIIISHKHSDHYDAITHLTSQFEVGTIVAPTDNDGLQNHIINNSKRPSKSKNIKFDTNFSKTYNFLGGTFENITAYSSKKTLDKINSINISNKQNDTSAVFRFTANGKVFLLPGDLEGTSPSMEDKGFKKKISEKKVNFYLAPHHGSFNAAQGLIPLIGNKQNRPEHVVITATDSIGGLGEVSGQRDALDNVVASVWNMNNNWNLNELQTKIHVTGAIKQGGNFHRNFDGASYIDWENTESSFEYKFSDGKWKFISHNGLNVSNRFGEQLITQI